ncbi:MAG: SIR2 family protein [Candidatus Hatepunaea meridiana]|nr:SIR2 family protein [Candidatus Hatepunaea meridiana]
MRITALLGAGASLEIGGPSTELLTILVRDKEQEFLDSTTRKIIKESIVDDVAKDIDRYLHPDRCNFEDIFSIFESLNSLNSGYHPGTSKEYKPLIGALVQPKTKRKKYFTDLRSILTAQKDIISVVAEKISEYSKAFDPLVEHKWYADFWDNSLTKYKWDIATLNYDDSVEQCVRGKLLFDGFELIEPGLYRFNPISFLKSVRSKIMHLHGCISFGYDFQSDPNKYLFEDQFEDLYKLDNYEKAKETWFTRSTNRAQSHEQAIAGPIITGLRKTDKILYYPYSTYLTYLQQVIIKSPRLFITGYSFSDFHLNAMLSRMRRIHGDKCRIVVVSYFPHAAELWHPEPMVNHWPDRETLEFIAQVSNNPGRFKNYRFQNPIVSENGCLYLYLKGMREAVENHSDEILGFLCST